MTEETDTFVIGFTGTRNGMTDPQLGRVFDVLRRILRRIRDRGDSTVRGVHGDCAGADDTFDTLCRGLGIPTGIHPAAVLPDLRARCDLRGATVLSRPKKPMARNRDIVADADVVIATPPTYDRIKRGSGTWATIGMAERADVTCCIVYPDGSITGADDHELTRPDPPAEDSPR